ncbi:MAG TPA: phytoene desaturase [Gemmatimonadaceae bacterium]|nr:phytoene desaturase [Gemmatimonadaceae bacterium]
MAGHAARAALGARLTMRIVVIGSGFGGLAAAIRLQASGHAVTIVEALTGPGGRARVFRHDGFTFDAGPTIITAPQMIDELFAVAGRRTGDYVSLTRIDPFYRIRFDDGSSLDYGSDLEAVRAQIRALAPADEDGLRTFVEQAERVFETGFPLIDKPFLRPADMMRIVPQLLRLRAHEPVSRFVERHFTDERLRQAFGFHPLLIGGNPFTASALYTLINTLERRWGVWYAMGGTGALVAGLVRLFEELGGTIRYRAPVSLIDVDPRTRRARGVVLANGEFLAADAVVSNADVATTYMRLVPVSARRVQTDARVRRRRYGMSLVVIYFGTDRRYEHMAHHEIIMGPRYRELLHDIFTEQRLASDFSIYLHRPTATDSSMAPPGCDAWYALSPVPHLGGDTDWARQSRVYRDAILANLERRFLPKLRRHIVTMRHVDPRYFADTLGSHLGSAFSAEPLLTQSAWFRPHNRSEDIENLYLAGAGTHPGAGIPGVLSSGKIVAELIGPAGDAPVGNVEPGRAAYRHPHRGNRTASAATAPERPVGDFEPPFHA